MSQNSSAAPRLAASYLPQSRTPAFSRPFRQPICQRAGSGILENPGMPTVHRNGFHDQSPRAPVFQAPSYSPQYHPYEQAGQVQAEFFMDSASDPNAYHDNYDQSNFVGRPEDFLDQHSFSRPLDNHAQSRFFSQPIMASRPHLSSQHSTKTMMRGSLSSSGPSPPSAPMQHFHGGYPDGGDDMAQYDEVFF